MSLELLRYETSEGFRVIPCLPEAFPNSQRSGDGNLEGGYWTTKYFAELSK